MAVTGRGVPIGDSAALNARRYDIWRHRQSLSAPMLPTRPHRSGTGSAALIAILTVAITPLMNA